MAVIQPPPWPPGSVSQETARICGKCKKKPALNGQGHCAECHKEYQRLWRRKQRIKVLATQLTDDELELLLKYRAEIRDRLG